MIIRPKSNIMARIFDYHEKNLPDKQDK